MLSGSNSTDMTSNVSNAAGSIIKGTIDSAVEQTGSIATNKNVVARVQNTFKFVSERKWMATFRGIPEFISPTEFCRPPPNQIMRRLQLNTQYFFTNYAAFACLLFSFTILTDPWLFFGMLLIGYGWMYAAKQPRLFNLEGKKKFGAMCLITTILLILLGFHETILYTLALGSGLTFVHAIMHKIPDAMEDYENDEDIILLGNVDNV